MRTGFFFVIALLAGCTGTSSNDASVDAPHDVALDQAPPTCTSDRDCDDGVFCNGVERCAPGTAGASRLGCVSPTPATPCMPTQMCDEAGLRCRTMCDVNGDADGDGHRAVSCGGDDCDDADAMRFPGNAEVCDAANHDEDCDAHTFGTRDTDGDGYIDGMCCNVDGSSRQCGDDCDDSRREVNPIASEVCDGFDNNCNGQIDEGVTVPGFADRDNDGYGDSTMPMMACAGLRDFATSGGDCNDADPRANPGLIEACDGVDNDCNGEVDDHTITVNWYADADGDGYGDPMSVVRSCAAPTTGRYVTFPFDCDDTRATVYRDAPELCDGLDNDCNGRADYTFGDAGTNTEDDDLDRHGDIACGGDDCNDAVSTTYTGAAELCDSVDNNCNGTIDEGTSIVPWFRDADGDGDGSVTAMPVLSCPPIPGSSTTNGDCNDLDPRVHTGAVELCDGIDQNCDGSIAGEDEDHDGLLGVSAMCTGGPRGGVPRTDCDDTNRNVRPGAAEVCNGLDDNCDGMVDNVPIALIGNDPANCGSCGHACAAGELCRAGRCGPLRKIIFVHTGTSSGNLGGLAGADAICQAAANAQAVGGTYRAFLSSSTANVSTRLTHATVPYVRIDGVTVANDWTGLLRGSILAPIRVDETGRDIGGAEVWTGTSATGTTATGCVDFTSGLSTDTYPCVGISSLADGRWACSYHQFCNRVGLGIYCVEQ